MLKTIVLICAISTDPSVCAVDTALDVVRMPASQNAMMCGLLGQAAIAPAIQPEPGKTYVKILCIRDRG